VVKKVEVIYWLMVVLSLKRCKWCKYMRHPHSTGWWYRDESVHICGEGPLLAEKNLDED
jgi:hypothetical protein